MGMPEITSDNGRHVARVSVPASDVISGILFSNSLMDDWDSIFITLSVQPAE